MINAIFRLLNSRGMTWVVLAGCAGGILAAVVIGRGDGWTLLQAATAGFALRELISD